MSPTQSKPDSGRPSDAELMRYMKTARWRRRVKATQQRVINGEIAITDFEAIAEALHLPIDVVEGGFVHSATKAGLLPIPQTRH